MGASGTIVVTSDGGATWSAEDLGTDVDLESVHFVDASHGWVVGKSGTILVTIDGGATWTAQDSGTGLGLSGVDFCRRRPRLGSRRRYPRNLDGGATWTQQEPWLGYSVSAVDFVDTNHGWLWVATRYLGHLERRH